MARRDGTGPMGAGTMTGRALGLCTGTNPQKHKKSCSMNKKPCYKNDSKLLISN